MKGSGESPESAGNSSNRWGFGRHFRAIDGIDACHIASITPNLLSSLVQMFLLVQPQEHHIHEMNPIRLRLRDAAEQQIHY
jgi:hypothetical protein